MLKTVLQEWYMNNWYMVNEFISTSTWYTVWTDAFLFIQSNDLLITIDYFDTIRQNKSTSFRDRVVLANQPGNTFQYMCQSISSIYVKWVKLRISLLYNLFLSVFPLCLIRELTFTHTIHPWKLTKQYECHLVDTTSWHQIYNSLWYLIFSEF